MRLIDLDRIKPPDFPYCEMDGLDAVRYLNTLPAIDAVPVVRCIDCKQSRVWEDSRGCTVLGCGLSCADLRPDDFCSYGERKEG